MATLSLSSVHICPWTHDVFFSLRGVHVHQTFNSHLYYVLDQRGIKTYLDKEFKKEEEISSQLLRAIARSMISIVVLSENYLDSRWHLIR